MSLSALEWNQNIFMQVVAALQKLTSLRICSKNNMYLLDFFQVHLLSKHKQIFRPIFNNSEAMQQ